MTITGHSSIDPEDMFESLRDSLDIIYDAVLALPEDIDPTDPDSAENVWLELRSARTTGAWWLATRLDELSTEMHEGLQELLNQPAPMGEYEANRSELANWGPVERVVDRGDAGDLNAAVAAIIKARDVGIGPRIDLEEWHRRHRRFLCRAEEAPKAVKRSNGTTD